MKVMLDLSFDLTLPKVRKFAVFPDDFLDRLRGRYRNTINQMNNSIFGQIVWFADPCTVHRHHFLIILSWICVDANRTVIVLAAIIPDNNKIILDLEDV